jgi:penicillin V acylase-like amidase (Ntn superfamily)
MCTFFRYKFGNRCFIGKNYEVPSPCSGLIFWNPAGIKKRALIKPPEEPVEWLSKYGNITFNQVGRDFPSSGMNEKGLIVEQTILWNTTDSNG